MKNNLKKPSQNSEKSKNIESTETLELGREMNPTRIHME